ncbi:MAG TPA: ADOP family duplicated permease [Gemmatimonadaceae bacterium]|nr:ADOP family duplicated permease [Gemmatimonadaceae bacterium]
MLADLPHLLSDLAYRLRTMFRRDAAERDMADEIQFHVDRETDRLASEGFSPTEARRQARIAFGGVEQIKEEARDAWGTRVTEYLLRDLANALRLARKQPGFSSVVALSLAFGLGATLTVFGLAHNVLFTPLPVPHPEQLVAPMRMTQDGRDYAFSWAEVQALRAVPVGELAASRTASAVAVSIAERRESINLHFVDGDYFGVAGVQPLRGRLISRQDDSTGAPVVVLSYAFAQRLFGVNAGVNAAVNTADDSNVVGKVVAIRGVPFTVIGVTPKTYRGLEFPGWFAAAVPIGSTLLFSGSEARDSRGIPYGRGDTRLTDELAFQLIGRLSVDLGAARRLLDGTFTSCCGAKPTGAAREWLDVVDIGRGIPGGKRDMRAAARNGFAMIMAGMGLVLVVVCCNIASLLLVRATARQREIAVRLSLGASRARLALQLVLENIPMALVGAIGGLMLANWFTAGFVRGLPADFGDIVHLLQFRYSPALLQATAVLTLLCVLAFAVYPALRATARPLSQALRLDVRASRSRRQGTVARGIVVAQVAVTVVIVTAAGLLATTLKNLARFDGGFATDRVLLAGLETRSTPYERQGMHPIADQIAREVGRVPGVRAVGMATHVPLFGGSTTFVGIDVPGYVAGDGKTPFVRQIATLPGYFAASGISLRSGREFDASDAGASQPSVIVNDAFVTRFMAGRDPVGRTLGVGLSENGGDTLTTVRVVGVVANVTYESLREQPPPQLYLPLRQTPDRAATMQLLVRTSAAPLTLASAVTKAVESAAPGINVRRVRDMATQRDDSMTIERLTAKLALFVSVMSLVLSTIGLYGVVAYSVTRRTSELGVRLALGARTRAILWLVSRETVWLVGIGLGIGAVLSYAATGALASVFFGVGPHDPTVAGLAALALAIVGLAASIAPARRAARIDPKIALNAD